MPRSEDEPMSTINTGVTYRQWLIGQVAPAILTCYLRQIADGKATVELWAGWPDGVAGDAAAFADAIIRVEREREMSHAASRR